MLKKYILIEDLQLIVDSAQQNTKQSLTLDGIFTAGIVSPPSQAYVQIGSQTNSLKILPFIGRTKLGNRIEVEYTYNNLFPAPNGAINTDTEKIGRILKNS